MEPINNSMDKRKKNRWTVFFSLGLVIVLALATTGLVLGLKEKKSTELDSLKEKVGKLEKNYSLEIAGKFNGLRKIIKYFFGQDKAWDINTNIKNSNLTTWENYPINPSNSKKLYSSKTLLVAEQIHKELAEKIEISKTISQYWIRSLQIKVNFKGQSTGLKLDGHDANSLVFSIEDEKIISAIYYDGFEAMRNSDNDKVNKEEKIINNDEEAQKLGYQNRLALKDLKVYLFKKNVNDPSLDDYHLALILNPKSLELKAVIASPANANGTTNVDLQLIKSGKGIEEKTAIQFHSNKIL